MNLSMLDLAPVAEGGSVAQALANAADLARHCEALGFTRYWLAEHHNMPGIASSATAVVIGHVAAATRTIRVGAGGIMLPNHAPLTVAEAFGTLDALHPGRIDLGLGRAPGSDQATARALRRYMTGADSFPDDVAELLAYLDGAEDLAVRAVPGAGVDVQVWVLGSSLFGAQLAAWLGFPYAFASHFAPDFLHEAAQVYRSRFRPSRRLAQPYLAVAMGCYAAPTDAAAVRLKTSVQLGFANLRLGRPGRLPAPVDDISQHLSPQVLAGVERALSFCVTGSPATIRAQAERLLAPLAPDEVILASQIHDHAARKASTSLAAEALRGLALGSVRQPAEGIA